MIRKGKIEDINPIMNLTKACAKAMIAKGIYQWNAHYPNPSAFKNDIDRNELRDAILKDHEITLNNYLENGSGVVGGGQTNATAPQLNMEASANTNTATMY